MRLIDADELEARVISFQGRGKKTFLEMLTSQPTAYDTDKVVEQLKAEYKPIVQGRRNGKTLRMGFNGGIARAIEIVKGGMI